MKSIQTIYSGIQSVIQLKLNSIQKKQNEAPCFPLTKEVRGRFSQKKNPKNDTLSLSKGLIFNATEKANGRFFSHNAKQRIVLAFITLLALLPQALQGQFITTWQTDNPGISGDNQITIPTTGDGYDYTVTWVDVNDATVTGTAGPFNGDATIDFPFAGTYQVSITGDFPQIYFNNTGDREKIINIDQWGDNVWLSMNKAFYSCVNLTSDAVDAPDLSQVTSMHSMFRNASSFNGDLSSWDVSNVETLNYTFGFASSFDGDISSWDVSNVENMSYLFYYASSFNQDLSSWEVDKVTQMNHMFRSASTFNQNLGSWDVSKVTNFSDFLDNSGLSSINYDATLDGWTSLPLLQSEVILGAEGLYYCSGVASRTYLADTYGWVFEGDIYSCGVTVPFVTTWQTDNPGTSADNQITIPTNGSGYDYTVTWVDVNDASVTGTVGPFSGDATIDFPVAGTYQVSITGDFPKIYFNNGGDKDKLLSVDQWGDNVWLSMQSAFFGCMNLTTDAVDAPDLRQVTSMNSMFRNASSFNGDLSSWDVSNVETLNYTFGFASSFDGDISSWDVSNVENMSYLFYYASSFNQDLSSWEVSNVKLMNHMFRGARAFDQQLGSWDVSNVENMRHMFYEAAIFNQDISGWDVGNVEDMDNLFYGATAFNQPIGSWNVERVKDMSYLFYNAAAFNQPIGSWSVDSVTNMKVMFRGAIAFNQDISSWNVENVTDMSTMFKYASSFNQPLDGWNVSKVTNMASIFEGATVFDQSMGDWDIGQVTSLSNALNNTSISQDHYNATLVGWAALPSLQTGVTLDANGLVYCDQPSRDVLTGTYSWTINGDSRASECLTSFDAFITTWQGDQVTIPTTGDGYDYSVTWVDVNDASVTGSAGPFAGDAFIVFPAEGTYQVSITGDFPRIYFNGGGDKDKLLSVDQWGEISWTSMDRAFAGCTNLRIVATDAPDLSQVTNFIYTFAGATSLNDPIGHWDVSNVTNMRQLFAGASSFNQDISSWDVSNVEDMDNLFNGATAFNQPIGSWNVAKVKDMSYLFYDASAFNQDIGSWTVGNVENMSVMFRGAIAFDQDINGWDVSRVTNMSGMFKYATAFNQPLDHWDVSEVTDMSDMFQGATHFNQEIGHWDVSKVEDLSYLFYQAGDFNQQLVGWDVSQVQNMAYLFYGATSFNQSLGTWDLSGVTTMDHALDNTAISQANYDDALSAWAALPAVPANVVLGASGLTYCNEEARSTLTDTYGWTIADAGKSGDCATPEPDPVSLDETLAHEVRYDGSITGMIWKNPTFTTEKLYTYHYDDMNRLTAAHYAEEAGGTFQGNRGYQSVPAIGYDYNGNIENLKRQGENNEGAIDVIDELSYSYDIDNDQPNQLMSVDDSRGVQAGFDNGNTSGDDYVYDANGNPIRDRNKGIESIEYNLLNLPTKITFNDNHYLTYLYDAAGIKLQQKEYRSDTLYKTTDYISSSIYVTMGQGEPVLQELMHDEGRIIPVTLSDSEGAVEGYDYQYRLSDHLGNTRVIYSTNLEKYTMVEDFENGAVNGFTDLHVTTDENANTTLPLGENNKTALLKSGETGALVFLHLNKGDTIDLQVNASYTDTPSDNTFASTAFSALFGTFNGTISGGEAPSALANEFNDALSGAAMAGKAEDTEAPRAYLNYIFFDDDMNYVTAGFEPITEAAYRVNAGEHETVRLDDIIADQEGYLLAYLSNENQEQVNVYFDDFTVHQSKTNLVFASDYYPYGMPFNQYYRTASIGSRYQYQGKEYLEEEGLNLYDFHARYYDPALGRFTTVDPQNQFASPYTGMGNNPVNGVDPDGEWVHIAIGAVVGGAINLAMNWDNIDNLWEGIAAFGIGAGAGAATAACGTCGGALWIAAAGGAVTSATNNIISQTGNGVGLNDVDYGQVGLSAVVGGVSGMAGYGAGKWATNNLANPLINGLNVKSPALSGLINGAIGGAAGGAAGGFTGGFILSGGDVGAGLDGAWNGFTNGAIIGGGTGVGMGYYQARRSNVNPWTGKSLSPQAKGDLGVQQAIKDIQKMGGKVLGERPAGYKLGDGRRGFSDLIVEIEGEIVIVEVKYGDGAALNPNQKINYPRINQGDFPTFSGPNGQVIPSGTTTIKVIVIHYTSKGRIIYSPYKK